MKDLWAAKAENRRHLTSDDKIAGVEELVEKIRKYNPNSESGLIRNAYDYAKEKHRNQLRKSGEPYFSHPVAVARYLIDQKLDDVMIATALLHDTLEDTESSYSEIEQIFGEETAKLVEGVTKLKVLSFEEENRQAQNLRKLLEAAHNDARVLLVKLADRLHNMRTIRHLDPAKQVVKAQETRDIYAPLAGKMGIQSWQQDLEDWAFKVLEPDARKSILRHYATLRKQAGELSPSPTQIIEEFDFELKTKLALRGINAEVKNRLKTPYSIWRKLEAKEQGFASLFDVYGFRIITETTAEVYSVLGEIHCNWTAIPGRFKDYVSQPKSNGYRSVHTTVNAKHGFRVEIQIRSKSMHAVAEYGMASHWAYRHGVRVMNPYVPDYLTWLSGLEPENPDRISAEEYLEHVKLHMAPDKVSCFTPAGDVVLLPKRATPIDFAYAIHTDIGDLCVGAKIDGKIMPLSTELRNGQTVEITTGKTKSPKQAWLNSVKTGRAKYAIRKFGREKDRRGDIEAIRNRLRAEFESIGIDLSRKVLALAAEKLGLKDQGALYRQLVSGQLKPERVVEVAYPELVRKEFKTSPERPEQLVLGLDGSSGELAKCCQPVPGETIYGIPTARGGVVVHSFDCAVLANQEDLSGWQKLEWHKGPYSPVHKTTLHIVLANEPAVLGRVCLLIGDLNCNISDLTFTDKKPDFYNMLVEVEVRDLWHLHTIIDSINADVKVMEISRHRLGEGG